MSTKWRPEPFWAVFGRLAQMFSKLRRTNFLVILGMLDGHRNVDRRENTEDQGLDHHHQGQVTHERDEGRVILVFGEG